MADFDAIIVGSGHNGLVSAFCLAKAGWRVLVLERASRIGGAICTEEITLPGYKHDLYATNFTLFTNSAVYLKHRAEFDAAGLSFLTCDHPYASTYRNGDVLRVYRDTAPTEAEFAKFSAEDLAGWRTAVALFKRIAPHAMPLTNMPLPSWQATRQFARMAIHLRSDLRHLRSIVTGSARQFTERYFVSDQAKGLFYPWSFHLDFDPDVRGGAAFSFFSAISAHLNGLNMAQGGGGEVVSALQSLIEKYGGVIKTDSEVTEILTENQRAIGVRTLNGETLRASRAVIANVTPRRLFGALLAGSDLPAPIRTRAANYRYGPGVFMVHLALSQPLSWRGADDLARFEYVHLQGQEKEVAAAYAQAVAGQLPARPMMIVSQPCDTDSSRTPPGHAVIRLQVRAVPAQIEGDAAEQINARAWPEAKEFLADRVIDQLVEHAPNARDVLLGRHVVSPQDFEHNNPNLIGGDCVSGSHHLDQNYFSRPFRGWSRYRTPLNALYMVGAFTWPGGGVNAGSGYLLAQDLLR